jgi:hypothetical protein
MLGKWTGRLFYCSWCSHSQHHLAHINQVEQQQLFTMGVTILDYLARPWSLPAKTPCLYFWSHTQKINPYFIIYTKKDRCHIDRSRPLYRVWHDHFQESLVPVGYEICLSVRASCYSFKAITTNNSPRLQILHKISSDNKVSGTSPWPLMTFK